MTLIWKPSRRVRIYQSIRATHDVFEATFGSWQWFNDGTESGATSFSTEGQANTNSPDVVSGNVIIGFRVRVDETGAGTADGATTDDWGLEFNYNATGATLLSASSSPFQAAGSGSGLTDGASTTQRLSNGPGAGTYINGEQEEINGVVEDHQLTGDDWTEHVFAITLLSASLTNGLSATWALTYNGSSGSPVVQPGTLPVLTIVKSAPPVEYPWYMTRGSRRRTIEIGV